MKETLVVGKSQIRKDAPQKAMAQAVYAGDMHFPGMLYGKALRAKYPHARILSIDTARAKAMPGVHAVLTAADIPGENLFGLAIRDHLNSREIITWLADLLPRLYTGLPASLSPRLLGGPSLDVQTLL